MSSPQKCFVGQSDDKSEVMKEPSESQEEKVWDRNSCTQWGRFALGSLPSPGCTETRKTILQALQGSHLNTWDPENYFLKHIPFFNLKKCGGFIFETWSFILSSGHLQTQMTQLVLASHLVLIWSQIFLSLISSGWLMCLNRHWTQWDFSCH